MYYVSEINGLKVSVSVAADQLQAMKGNFRSTFSTDLAKNNEGTLKLTVNTDDEAWNLLSHESVEFFTPYGGAACRRALSRAVGHVIANPGHYN